MSEPKFTHGKLHTEIHRFENGEVNVSILNSKNHFVGLVTSHTDKTSNQNIPADEALANAFLFAAAPAMYASLQNCVNLLRHLGLNGFACMVETTLRQARGENEVSK